jgi:uncharacterized protein
MNSCTRIFAKELLDTTFQPPAGPSDPSPPPLSPTGAKCRHIYLSGALTRIQETPGAVMAWVSDPTGTFLLSSGNDDDAAMNALTGIEPPVFVAAVAEVRYAPGRRKDHPLALVSIRIVDRVIRDTWVIRTAEITLSRIAALQDAIRNGPKDPEISGLIRHYNLDDTRIGVYIGSVEDAVSKVKAVPGGPITARASDEVILELIRSGSSPKGIEVKDLISLAAARGIPADTVLSVLRKLVEEDECYQPAAGVVKLL